jgi:isopentenyldiphosphate isomerase
LGLYECATKECEEESCIPHEISSNLVQVNAISYAYENDHGINKEVEFVFDLKLPTTFRPKIGDGEVESFKLMTIDEVKEALISDNFKPNSAAITLDFLMRKGIVNAENDPNYLYIIKKLHSGKNN